MLDLSWHIKYACKGPPFDAEAGICKYDPPYPKPWPHAAPPPLFLAALHKYYPLKGIIKRTEVTISDVVDTLVNDASSLIPQCNVCGRSFNGERLAAHQVYGQ